MENQRIRLTRQMLHEALLHLMQSKEVEQISVSELCRAAGVNRTTFYKYYQSPIDVMHDLPRLCPYQKLPPNQRSDQTDLEQLTQLLAAVEQNVARASVLNNETTKALLKSDTSRVKDDAFYDLLAAPVAEDVRFYTRHMVSAAMTYWLSQENRLAPERFARLLLGVTQVSREI